MEKDTSNQYRSGFEKLFNDFPDRVDNPWETAVPDVSVFNGNTYNIINRQLQTLQRDPQHKSRGLLILGAAGTGKTHILMRVAKNLSSTSPGGNDTKSHTLFVRRPNNEDAVAQHIWDNIVTSLDQTLADISTSEVPKRSQLDNMLAHVFSNIIIPELEQDVREGKDAEKKERWIRGLQNDPFYLIEFLGQGEQRQKNINYVRNKTLSFLKIHQPEVDQTVAKVLITYSLVETGKRKRLMLEWLRGQEIDQQKSEELGLQTTTWGRSDETSSDAAVQQEREKFALKAIQTIAILSTYYRPLILAFDQLEGLRGKEILTRNWGDTVREIFTMSPNLLILTCIFPDLWEYWFQPNLDQSVSERIAQNQIELEPFTESVGMTFLPIYMKPWYQEFRLPNVIYPFESKDIEQICKKAKSPRQFLQETNRYLQNWIYSKEEIMPASIDLPPDRTEINDFIYKRLEDAFQRKKKELEHSIPIENDYFGRIRSILETFIATNPQVELYPRATYGSRVMPQNLILRDTAQSRSVCFGVLNCEAISFTSRMKNLMAALNEGEQFSIALVFRDQRCRGLGAKSREYIETFRSRQGIFYEMDNMETAFIFAVYDILTAIEEHDMTLRNHSVDMPEFIDHLFVQGELTRYVFFKLMFEHLPVLAKKLVVEEPRQNQESKIVSPPLPFQSTAAKLSPSTKENPLLNPFEYQPSDAKPSPSTSSSHNKQQETVKQYQTAFPVDVIIGNKNLDTNQCGILGKMKEGGQRIGFSFSKPMCCLVAGYMGSGKSYALGVLIENAVMNTPDLTSNQRPMSVVAFNYRRNPDSRFEYAASTQPNNNMAEVGRLVVDYHAYPAGIQHLNVLGYEPELARRQDEYGAAKTYPIKFLPDELRAEHWELLMKPPTVQAEYMNIVRDIIQKLFYADLLTLQNIETAVDEDERLSPAQRQRVKSRLSFAKKWITDKRDYTWKDILSPGTFTVFDLRMQASTGQDACVLCLILSDIVRRTQTDFNKMIIFDEAHEYVDSKMLIDELANAITQIRHDGLSFIFATQFPEQIPHNVIKYLTTKLIFKIPDSKAIKYLQSSSPNLENLPPHKITNLRTESGECLLQTDDDCSDLTFRKPQLITVRPRCSQHGGATKRS